MLRGQQNRFYVQLVCRQSLHGQLVHLILAQGNDLRMEKLSCRASQKQFGRSVALRAPGTFVRLLKRKAANAGATVTEFSTTTTKLSQTCHHCGKVKKKRLRQSVQSGSAQLLLSMPSERPSILQNPPPLGVGCSQTFKLDRKLQSLYAIFR